MIPRWEQHLTDKIYAWGKKNYATWYFLAVHLFNFYALLWVILGCLGWLAWHVLPLVLLSSWIVTLAVQALVGRERPSFEKTTGYKMWWRTYSLPSGHALISSALGMTILLQTHFPSPLLLIIAAIAFVVAEMLIGLGRIVVGVHYFGDIIVGFVLGIGFGVVYGIM